LDHIISFLSANFLKRQFLSANFFAENERKSPKVFKRENRQMFLNANFFLPKMSENRQKL
jgi:hypothetical protein